MPKITEITYGVGGYNPKAKDKNIVSVETHDVAPPPLPPVGALATMLAVAEVLTVEDAANAVGLTPADLVAEAEAWAAAE